MIIIIIVCMILVIAAAIGQWYINNKQQKCICGLYDICKSQNKINKIKSAQTEALTNRVEEIQTQVNMVWKHIDLSDKEIDKIFNRLDEMTPREREAFTEYDILMIRVCKDVDGDECIKRLKKITEREYLVCDANILLNHLFEIACKIYPQDMMWAFSLGYDKYQHDAKQTFVQTATLQIISKLRLTPIEILKDHGFVMAAKYKNK